MLTDGYLFDETKVEKVSQDDAKGISVYERTTHKRWFGAVGLFGGYVLPIVLQALTAEVDDPLRLPRSLSAHFLRPYPVGTFRIETKIERAGSSVSVLSYKTFVGDELCGLGIGTFGKNREAQEWEHIEPPPAKLYDRSFDETAKRATEEHSLLCLENFEIWVEDEKIAKEKSELVAWVRMNQEFENVKTLDNLFYLAAADVVPPVITKRGDIGSHFMGTMDFMAYFRRPDILLKDEPALVRIYSASSKQGYVDEDCEIFSPAGELLLQSRQMRFTQTVDQSQMNKKMKEKLKDA